MKQPGIYLSELQRDLEREEDADSNAELEALYEAADDLEAEIGADEGLEASEFGGRFYEISRREYESAAERNEAIDDTLTEMERRYFFGKVFKKIKRGGMGGFIRKAAKLAGKVAGGPLKNLVPGIGSLTQLARGNLKGLLGSLAKDGLNSLIPGAGLVAGPALGALGLQEIGDIDASRRVWSERYAEFAQRAFEALADGVTEATDSMAEASRAASNAFQQAAGQGFGRRAGGAGASTVRRIRLRSGDRVVIQVD